MKNFKLFNSSLSHFVSQGDTLETNVKTWSALTFKPIFCNTYTEVTGLKGPFSLWMEGIFYSARLEEKQMTFHLQWGKTWNKSTFLHIWLRKFNSDMVQNLVITRLYRIIKCSNTINILMMVEASSSHEEYGKKMISWCQALTW